MIEAPADGSCERCRARVPVADTYEHDGRRWHRVGERRKGRVCGPVYTTFEYRLVFHVEEVVALPSPLASEDEWRALEQRIARATGAARVCLMIREPIGRS